MGVGAQTSKIKGQDQNLLKVGEFEEKKLWVRDFKEDQASKLLAEGWKKLEEDEQRGGKRGIGHKRKASEHSLTFRTKKTVGGQGGKATGPSGRP